MTAAARATSLANVLRFPSGADSAGRAAAKYASTASAIETRRAYKSDWRAWTAWTEAAGIEWTVATGDDVAAYVAGRALPFTVDMLRETLAAP